MNALISSFLTEFDGSANTVATYSQTIRIFFRWMINNRRDAANPTRADVTQYKKQLQAKGHTAKTVDNYLNALKSFFRWTSERGHYENIASHIRSNATTYEMLKEPLTISQVQTLLNSCNTLTDTGTRNRAIIHLLYFCGLRVVEVSRLTFSDYHPDYLMIQGKGRITKEEVYLPQLAADALKQYIACRKHNEGKIHPDAPLFISYAHNQKNKLIPVSKQTISDMVRAQLIKAGLKTDKISAHSLRHSIAIHMIDEGATLYDITQKLRHTDANMSRIYTRYIEKKKVRENAAFAVVQSKFSQKPNAIAI